MQFNAPEYSVEEDEGSVRICVELLGAVERAVSVQFMTLPSSAQGLAIILDSFTRNLHTLGPVIM